MMQDLFSQTNHKNLKCLKSSEVTGKPVLSSGLVMGVRGDLEAILR